MRNVHARFLDPHADCVRRTYGALDADKIPLPVYFAHVHRLPHNPRCAHGSAMKYSLNAPPMVRGADAAGSFSLVCVIRH